MRGTKLLLTFLAFSWTTPALAQEQAIPHILVPGQVVSADILNEVFSAVKPDLGTTLVGTWSTQCWDNNITDVNLPGTGTLSITSLSSISFTGISCMAGMSAIHQLSIFPLCGEICYPTYGISQLDALGNQALFVTTTDNDKNPGMEVVTRNRVASILQLERNQITISWPDTGYGKAGIEVLNRTNLVPAIPTTLAATATGTSVALTWIDASSDETGFRVLRRDGLAGTFTEIATPAANAITYADTSLAAGVYWYRVQSVNANGNSLGSNLAKVTIE